MSIIASTVDLSGGWTRVWNSVENVLGSQMANLLTAVGVIIVVAAFFKWMWERRRGGGGGGGANGIMWSLLLGATLAAPGLVIPIVLEILDAVANSVIGIWSSSG